MINFAVNRLTYQSTTHMKKKFRKVLSEKCADFGLTSKAIDELTDLGSANLKDDASDEDIAAAVDLLVPYAKAMQGEITRKAQSKQSTKQSDKEGKGEGKEDTDMPDWFKEWKESNDTRIAALEKENSDLKAEKTATERAKTIAEKAKKLGIPDFLLKGRTFADDADLDKELSEFKQQLVNHNLVPKGQTHGSATATEQMISEEDSWAKSLPDKK